MDTKTCEKCGWVVAIQNPGNFCPICGTRFMYGICAICKQPVRFYRDNRSVCKTCYDTVTRKPDANARVYDRREQMYEEWKAKIAKVPKDYPTLTEEQWMAACKHFDGCACCGAPSIDTRGYFVAFKEGGRYCDWNIIPMCEQCALKTRLNPNVFLRQRPDNLVDILTYLEAKLDAAGKN